MVTKEFGDNQLPFSSASSVEDAGENSFSTSVNGWDCVGDSTEAIAIEGLWWRYPTFSEKPNAWTLRDISLHVRQGECFGITGPSGAGKTTLCRSLLGIIPHNAHLTNEQLSQHFRGQLSILGEPVTAHTAQTQKIGMVLQDPENQFLRMSLLHELSLGLQIKGLSHEEIVRRSFEALQWVGLEHLWPGAIYQHPADLSGGQKQRVAIAAFLAMRPDILILDEPTSDLDPVGKREVIETIARLRRDYHMTVVLVEQDPDILSTFCDRIALLHEGRVELVAPPPIFYRERQLLERCGASVSELVRISWYSGYTPGERLPLTVDDAAAAFSPLATALVAPCEQDVPVRPASEEAVVQAQGVTYHYDDGTLALKGVDLTLYRGEMLALLGPNGSGKTTFAKIVAGIYRASQGEVLVAGKNLAARKVRAHISRLVGYVFQNPDHQLFCRKVREEIEYGLKNLGIEARRRREIVTSTLEAVDLVHYADEDPLFLSKGERQRLAVASVLAMGPHILVVDEPTTGQDHGSITAMMRLLCDLQQQGKTILIITHDMTLVSEYCQRVVAFRDGLVSFSGKPAELFGNVNALRETGLRPPVAAAVTMKLRERYPAFPKLLTARQWSDVIRGAR